jgi:hypothetical protein
MPANKFARNEYREFFQHRDSSRRHRPDRRSKMAWMGFHAMAGGLLAAYMTASLAGFLL